MTLASPETWKIGFRVHPTVISRTSNNYTEAAAAWFTNARPKFTTGKSAPRRAATRHAALARPPDRTIIEGQVTDVIEAVVALIRMWLAWHRSSASSGTAR